jgi:hypothetical protein
MQANLYISYDNLGGAFPNLFFTQTKSEIVIIVIKALRSSGIWQRNDSNAGWLAGWLVALFN